jgi:hypothetical protein
LRPPLDFFDVDDPRRERELELDDGALADLDDDALADPEARPRPPLEPPDDLRAELDFDPELRDDPRPELDFDADLELVRPRACWARPRFGFSSSASSSSESSSPSSDSSEETSSSRSAYSRFLS